MRVKVFFLGALLACASLGALQTMAQDEDVRGAFLTSRPKTSDKSKTTNASAKPNRRRPKTAVVNPSTKGSLPAADPKANSTTPPKPGTPRIGLGLTLFMRDSNGLSVRVDPTREFRKGDHVRFLLETNADGYLYVFNTTNSGAPMMLYPDPELDEGGNYLQSHVPFETPSSLATEERLRWFTFDAVSGIEKLYFVFTREPLAGVPTEDDLITLCRTKSGVCPWAPEAELWAKIQKGAIASSQAGKVTGVGKAQTEPERLAATRGIGLNRDDAEPSLIMLTASSSEDMLVATLELVHKSASLMVEDEVSADDLKIEAPRK